MSPHRTRRRATSASAAVAAGLLALVLSGCSSTGHPATGSSTGAAATAGGTTAQSGAQIVIKNFDYQPMDLAVSPGQKVTVVNQDSTAHTLTASDGHAFDTGRIDGGASGSFTAPTKPGSYPYICTIHQFMHGTVTVR